MSRKNKGLSKRAVSMELTHGYVSGPMRGKPYFNREEFARVTKNVRAQGFVAFNPFEKDQQQYGADFADDNTEGVEDTAFDLRAALLTDCEWICRHANFLVMLDGWEESLGATAERALAIALHIPILSEHDFESPKVGISTGGVQEIRVVDASAHVTCCPICPTSVFADDGSCLCDCHKADWQKEVDSRIAAAYPRSDEIRVVDPVTGGEKGSKLAQLGALDPSALMDVAKVAGFGAQKYKMFNYAKGYAWSLSYNALQRHLHAWWSGQDTDDEPGGSGLNHLAHAAWHCLALLTFQRFGKGTDDRFPLR